jgi:hypothetical protein
MRKKDQHPNENSKARVMYVIEILY